MFPIFSTSATSVSPAAPPNTTAPNLCVPDNLFNSSAFFLPFAIFLFLKLTSLPAFFAFNAFVANVVASFAPAAPGIPICINASESLPMALCSAISSSGLSLSKNASTCAAEFSVAPRSKSSAPRDTTPSTVFMAPDPSPATNAVAPDTSLLSSASANCISVSSLPS